LDFGTYWKVLHEFFNCDLPSWVKCELCEDQPNDLQTKGLSLCISGKINQRSYARIHSIAKKYNLNDKLIKNKGAKALIIYTPN